MKYLMRFLAQLSLTLFSTRKIREMVEYLVLQKVAKVPPEEGLRFMLAIDSFISKYTHRVAIAFNGGEHPCHYIIDYKQFYIDRITPQYVVLDVGSHEGDIVYAMAKATGAKVYGVELLPDRVETAKQRNAHPNATYICGDALTLNLDVRVNVIVLSAVLEHIEPRVEFLKKLVEHYQPQKILIRVPMFTRDWRVPMRKQLGINYFMDSTHYIEYTRPEFEVEMAESGLAITEMQIDWGEIWAVCEPTAITGRAELEYPKHEMQVTQ